MRTTLPNFFRKTLYISFLFLFATTTTSAFEMVANNNDATEILPSSIIEAIGKSFKLYDSSLTNTDSYRKTIENSIITSTAFDNNGLEVVARLKTNYEVGDVDCYGGNNGYATVYITGGTEPYTYQWRHGATTQTIENLAAGTYRLAVEDADGNRTNCRVRIKEPSKLSHSITKLNDASAYGSSDGSAKVRVTGGTQPYTYAWDNGETTDIATALNAGQHTVVVTDANGCTIECSVVIDEPELEPEDCKVAGDDCAITVCEGTQPSEQQLFAALIGEDPGGIWSDPVNGVYTYTIAAAGTCPKDSATVTVTEEKAPSAGQDAQLALCDSDDDPSMADLLALLGNPTDGEWSPSIYNGAGDYTYTIAGTTTCPASSATVTVTITDKPTTEITNVTICSDEEYTWAEADGGNGETYDSAVDITLQNDGCTADQQLIVTVADPNAGTDTSLEICEGDDQPTNDELFAALELAGDPDDDGEWSGPVNGVYTYKVTSTVTSGADCEDTSTVTVTITGKPTTEITNVTICSDEEYTWAEADGGNGETYDAAVDITLQNDGCTADQQLIVTVADPNAGTDTSLEICEGDDQPTNDELFAALELAGDPDDDGEWSGPVNGVYTYKVTSTVTSGADCEDTSTVTVTITDKPTTEITNVTICSDEEYTWAEADGGNGETYDAAVDITLQNDGCTADQQLIVTVADPNAGTDTSLEICEGDDQPTNDELFAALELAGDPDDDGEWSGPVNGVYTYKVTSTVTSGADCEDTSTVTVTITGKPTTEITNVTICSDEEYTWAEADGGNGETYDAAVDITLQNDGCTADQQLIVTVADPNAGTDTSLEICERDDQPTNDELFAALELAGDPDDDGEWSGPVNGVYTYKVTSTVTSGADCEDTSTVTVTITGKPTTEITNVTICSDEEYTWAEADGGNGETYDAAVDITLQNDGCTADQQLIVTVADPNAGTDTSLEICEGDDQPTNDELFAALELAGDPDDDGEWSGPVNGVYTYKVTSTVTSGADCEDTSTVTVTITDKPTTEITNVTICSDEEYTWAEADGGNGETYDAAVDITLQNDGCTADQQLIVTVADPNAGTDTSLEICEGDDQPTNDELFAALELAGDPDDDGEWSGPVNGVYTYKVTSTVTSGADCEDTSTVTVTITGKPDTVVTEETICEDEEYTWAVNGVTYDIDDAVNGIVDITIEGENCEADQQLIVTIEDCCETAFARYDEGGVEDEIDETNDGRCFEDDGFQRWGWTNLFSAAGTYHLQLYSGAGQCDFINKGDHSGNVTVDWDDNDMVTVTINLFPGWEMQEAHLYVGGNDYPTITQGQNVVETVAPGQYPDQDGDGDNPEITAPFTSYTFNPVDVSGLSEIYVIAHAVTCEVEEICDTATTYYMDADGDSYGDAGDTGTQYCADPGTGYSQTNDDCNDGDAAINPGATEIPGDDIDNDCDPATPDTDPCDFSTQLGQDIDGEAALDYSGRSVSMSADGSRVAIGALWNDGNGNDSGHVRVYDLIGSTWTQVGDDINGEAAGDQSGISVSLSADGSRVAIGANGNNGNGVNSGHVRVYDLIGSTWTQVGDDINGEAAGDQSGLSVSMSADGSRVAIGTYWNDGNGVNSGHVRVYDWNGSSWVQLGTDIDGEAAGDESGRSVSMSADGSRVAIGALSNDGNGGNSGHVRVYDLIGSTWIQVGADIDGEAVDDFSGYSVSLSADGSRVAIGAPGNDGNGSSSGHVRVYDLIGSTWTQVGDDIDGEAVFDQSGISVSLSADGSRVAIGANLNDGNGTLSGHVRVYDLIGSTWTQVGADIDGEAADDQSGLSVSLSADGSRVAIGAYLNDGNGGNSGHVRVYGCAQAAQEEEESLVLRQSSLSSVTVFQKPQSKVLSVDLDISYDAEVNTSFQDLSGRTVLTAPTSQVSAGNNHLEYDLGTLPTEVLIMKVYTGREVITKKVLIINK